MEQNDAEELVARAARKIEQLLRKRSGALEVRLIPLRRAASRQTKSSIRFLKTFRDFYMFMGSAICAIAFKILRRRSMTQERMDEGEFFINSAQTCATSSSFSF